MYWRIEVNRKDGSVRNVEIMYDRMEKKYAFVNLTTHHICSCRFESIQEAMYDLMNDENVDSFNVKNCNGNIMP